MSIRKTQNGWRAVARVRVQGRIIEKARMCKTREAAKRTLEELKKEIRESEPDSSCSLKCDTLSELITQYLARRGDGRMRNKFDYLKREIGDAPIAQIAERFDVFLYGIDGRGGIVHEICPATGRMRKPATTNRYIAVMKMVCSFGVGIGALESNPILRFKQEPEEGRDRVLSPEEERTFLETLEREGSYLLPAVQFALHNPIRFSDLFNLTRENWDEFNGWIHFYASKTRKRRNRETCLVCIDQDTRAWFKSLPSDCPYLFPKITEAGKWEQVPARISKHWATMCRKAGIEDFRFHDLKHCGITWMRDNGFTELDFENLGIQYSLAMIRRYYKQDARKAVAKWKELAVCVG